MNSFFSFGAGLLLMNSFPPGSWIFWIRKLVSDEVFCSGRKGADGFHITMLQRNSHMVISEPHT